MPRSLSLLLLTGLAVGCSLADPPRVPAPAIESATTPPPQLLGAEPIVGEIEPGERHRYRLDLAGDRWIVIELAQREVDLDLLIYDASGRPMGSAATPGNWQTDRLEVITDAEAGWMVEVAAVPGTVRRGNYRLRLAEEREAQPDDEARRAALAELRTIERPTLEAPGRSAEELEGLLRGLLAGSQIAWSDTEAARLHGILARILVTRQQSDEAAAAYRAGLERSAAAGPSSIAVDLMLGLGGVLAFQRSFDEAGEQFRWAVETARAIGGGEILALALNSQAGHLYSRGEYDAARDRLEEAVEVTRGVADAPGEVSTRLNLSRILLLLGEPLAAFAQYEEAQRRADEMNVVDDGRRASLLRTAGALFRAAGELDRALTAYSDGLAITLAAGDETDEMSLRNHLGALLGQLGKYGDAREHLLRSALLAEAAGNTSHHSSALLHLGWIALGEADPTNAIALIEQGLAMPGLAHDTEISLLYALGVAKTQLGQTDEAQALLARVVQGSQRRGLRRTTLDAMRALGTIHLEAGALDLAATTLGTARELAAVSDDPLRQAAIESLLARLAAERDSPETALAHTLAAIALRESMRSQLADVDLRISFLARWRGDFDRAIEMLMVLAAAEPSAGHDRRAFELSEAAHARTLTELLTEARVEVRRGVSDELSAEESEADRRLSLVESELTELFKKKVTPEGEHERRKLETALRRDREDFRRQHAEVKARIRRSHPSYADIRYPQPPSVEEVQSWLPPRTALLEYALGERSSVLFVITRDSFDALALPASREIALRVAQARRELAKPGGLTQRRLKEALGDLTHILFAPAADRIVDVDRLVVIPDGDLFHLPFEALSDPAAPEQTAGGALRRWTISYLPSAAVWPHLGRAVTPAWQRDLLVLADPPSTAPVDGGSREGFAPLPGAASEAKRIAALFLPERVGLYLGEAAREGLLKESGPGASARRLHIASHVVISTSDAADSYLLLAADPPQDGKLHLREVFNLDLAAELVVLSGCETALGPQVAGEGVLGFARGFLYAGASDLVVSLWPVSDAATEELMVDFYRQILAGLPPEEALRVAKLTRLDDGVSRPFIWAPFIAFGAPTLDAVAAAATVPPDVPSPGSGMESENR